MFDFFGKQKEAIQQSFEKVRQDTAALSEWVRFLFADNRRLEERVSVQRNLIDMLQLSLRELKVNLQSIPRKEDVRQMVESHYDFRPILAKIRQIESKLEVLELRHRELRQPHYAVQEPLPVQNSVPRPSALKDKLVRKLARNSKEYIKNFVRGLVHKYGRISALQLREIVVDEQGLCSKSSFYRVLEEMERENAIAEVSDGKNKVFVAQTA